MTHLFIADLHLRQEDPATVAAFQSFLETTASRAGSLYILGDLFEAWIGDDGLAHPLASDVARRLKQLADAGVAVHLMHGNRDFLLGAAFATACGARLLDEGHVADLHGTPTLLMHGDSLCTDDTAYQQFRAQVRQPAWQQAFLARPMAERIAVARQLREQSEQAKGEKSMAIMDVNADAVAEQFRRHGVNRLIHGHTHRPARHELSVDGIPRERWVLPDWYGPGGYLACDAGGCRLMGLGTPA